MITKLKRTLTWSALLHQCLTHLKIQPPNVTYVRECVPICIVYKEKKKTDLHDVDSIIDRQREIKFSLRLYKNGMEKG